MEGGATPTQNIPYIFTPSLQDTNSSQNHLPHHSQQPQADGLLAPDIVEWAALLSGQIGFAEQKPNPESVLMGRVEQGTGETNEEKGQMIKTKKASRPRFAFQTRSATDILDDGYRWRKYGQKAVKNSIFPSLFCLIISKSIESRSYYRCTHHTCNVKKQVQRLCKDRSIVVTTYEGVHNHPCQMLMESLSPLLKQMQFLARF